MHAWMCAESARREGMHGHGLGEEPDMGISGAWMRGRVDGVGAREWMEIGKVGKGPGGHEPVWIGHKGMDGSGWECTRRGRKGMDGIQWIEGLSTVCGWCGSKAEGVDGNGWGEVPGGHERVRRARRA